MKFTLFTTKNPLFLPSLGLIVGIVVRESLISVSLSWMVGASALFVLGACVGKVPVRLGVVGFFIVLGWIVMDGSHRRQDDLSLAKPRCMILQSQHREHAWIARSCDTDHRVSIMVHTSGLEGWQDSLQVGRELITASPAQPIERGEIPGLFSYSKYLYRKGVTHQVWLRSSNAELGGQHELTRMDRWRAQIEKGIEANFEDEQHAAILEAFILGQRTDLSKETNEIFRRAGAIHILAVSGLHVGIIAMILQFLWRIMLGSRGSVWFRSAVVISGLWLFACLTGFSPSVSRAAFMFSLFLLSHCFPLRHRSSLNVLAASAFFLLLLDPFRLYDIGFQFSHLAVLGIILFYPLLKGLWKPKGSILSYAWDIVLISFCAQVFIVPFALYYFGETSRVSVATSLVCIPAAAVIVSGAVAFVVSWLLIPQVAELISWLLSWILEGLVLFLSFFAKVSWAVWEQPHVDLVVLTSCLLAILAMYMSVICSYRWCKVGALSLMVMTMMYHQVNADVKEHEALLVAEKVQRQWRYDLWYEDKQVVYGEPHPTWTKSLLAAKYAREYSPLASKEGWEVCMGELLVVLDESPQIILGETVIEFGEDNLPEDRVGLITLEKDSDRFKVWKINRINED